MSNISIVVSFCSKSFGTGAGGKIPWNIPDERKNLADLTKGHVVVMGRRTFEDFGSRPLDGRFNVVVSGSAGAGGGAGSEQQNMAIVLNVSIPMTVDAVDVTISDDTNCRTSSHYIDSY
jgi:dihydrofolate reductase